MISCTRILTSSGSSNPSLDTTKYRTFKIVSPTEGKLPQELTQADYHLIANAIRRELFIRGMVEKSTPDLFINIGITHLLKPEGEGHLPKGAYPIFIADRSGYFNTNFFSGKEMDDLLTPGRIVIDIVDLKNQKVLNSLISELDFASSKMITSKEVIISKIINELFNKINSGK
ncbi:MAG: DUF4136 domain-containing protein [Bacteroidales bacterium]